MSVIDTDWEQKRLTALASYDILDTPRERDFDDIALLASEICETPIAVVNLIASDRQFFKAEVGLGVRETPLDSSFCAKAILEDDFLEVPDATLDGRFDCNPLVIGEPHFRFYAGKLLKTVDGLAVGTLCVLDVKPRRLSALQRQALDVLGRQVMAQIELRRALAFQTAAMEQRAIAQQETSHRLKNTLAMVQAIAAQTLRHVHDRDALASFQSRLQSLAAANDILFRETWETAELQDVVQGVLAHLIPAAHRTISGPPVALGSRAALATSLIIHELTTNAVKYGSLSNEGGRVDIAWSTDGANLAFTWRETGGPPARVPETQGFGSKLLRMGLGSSGGTELRYEDDGFSAHLTASLEMLAQS
ncbi:MAG: sensor histidine kinase [Brevundimonas sp.]